MILSSYLSKLPVFHGNNNNTLNYHLCQEEHENSCRLNQSCLKVYNLLEGMTHIFPEVSPSHQWIAKKVGLSVRYVIIIIQKLVKLGLLISIYRHRKTSIYQIPSRLRQWLASWIQDFNLLFTPLRSYIYIYKNYTQVGTETKLPFANTTKLIPNVEIWKYFEDDIPTIKKRDDEMDFYYKGGT